MRNASNMRQRSVPRDDLRIINVAAKISIREQMRIALAAQKRGVPVGRLIRETVLRAIEEQRA